MRRINWITGGRVSENWAYQNNSKNLIRKLYNYTHELDLDIDVCDIVVFFDILLMQRNILNFPKAKKILRLGGIRPFDILKSRKTDCEKLIKKANAIISVNNGLLGVLPENQSNTYVIPNSVNMKTFNSDGYEPPKKFTIGFSGNVSNDEQKEWKGYNLVLETAKQMDLPLKTALRSRFEIKHCNMKRDFYNKISCLILPSTSEGCSNVVAEALASGVPVIINRDNSFHSNNLIEGQNIIYCDRNVFSICNCIKFLQDETHWKTLSENGQKFIQEYQDLNIISKQWEEVIKKL